MQPGAVALRREAASRTVTLAAVEADLAEAWHAHCGDLPGVTVHPGSILALSCDAVVSPANSYGFMDGGIDGVYARHFGPELERRVRNVIAERHGGELPVGLADVVPTGNEAIPHLIVAPTMRVPMKLQDTVNPYLAARAVFRLMLSNAELRSVAMPGLGTGVGGVRPEVCARQVARAYRDVVLREFEAPDSWLEASVRHQLLYEESARDLQFDEGDVSRPRDRRDRS